MTFARRIRGVLALDVSTFEEIEANAAINGQACAVVVLASIAASAGSTGLFGQIEFVRGVLYALFLWVVWAAVIYAIGSRLLPEAQTRTDMGELLRVLGFSSAPNLFTIFGAVPVLGWIVWAVASVWVLATTVIAVRQALDYVSTLRAVAVVLLAWAPVVLINWIVY